MLKNTKFNLLFILIAFSFGFCTNLLGQSNFISIEYNNQLNMPTNLTKAIEIDKLGFVWIATDAGLVKFDGKTFSVFKNELPSQYIKDLIKLKNGDVLVITDLGISRIFSKLNTHQITNFIAGNTSSTDSTVFYPKTAFEDSENNLWISEPDAIVKLRNGKITRFAFSDDQRADSYFRSFLFVEDDNGNLIASSQKGSLFVYSKILDKFVKIFSFPEKFVRIDALHKTKSGEILVGTNTGVFKFKYNSNFKKASIENISNISNVSSIKNFGNNSLLIGTWTNGIYLINGSNNLQKISQLKFSNISNITTNETENIWIASDEGFALINETFFSTIKINSLSYYIENVSKSADGNTFVTEGNSIFLVETSNEKPKIEIIFSKTESLILCAAGTSDNLWISYRDGFVEHRKNNKISKINLPQTESVNRLVRAIFLDDNKSIWATEEGFKGIIKIDDSNNFKLYNSKNGIDTYSQSIAKDKLGNLFVGGVGLNSFLYLYDRKNDKFINQSKIEISGNNADFQVNEIVFDSKNNIWLGTNYGLFYREINGKIFKPINLANYPEINIKSLAIDGKDRIWIGFEYGILLLSNGGVSRFDANDGLPNLTMTYRASIIDKNDRLIIGTARGLVYLQKKINEKSVTNPPIITNIWENNKQKYDIFSNLEFDKNSYLEINFISLTYPNEKVQYQWRLLGIDSTWSEPSNNTKLGLAQIEAGDFTFQLRSQKTGYLWSNPTEISFSVNKPFYQTYYAIALYFIILALIIITTIHYRKLIKEKKWIEQKIQSFFTLSSDLIAIVNPKGSILFTNSIWSSKLFYSSEELKLVNFFNLFHEDEIEKVKFEFAQLMNSENSISFETRLIDKNATVGFYSWNFSISADKEFLFGIGRNINEIMQMQSELAELNKNKDILFSVISHDLRAPFNSLLGYTKMLLDEFNSFTQAEIKEIVESSYKSSQKAFDLLDDLLNWSKIQMNKVRIVFEERDLSQLVEEEISGFKDILRNKNIVLVKKLGSIIYNVDVNSYKIVFRNVFSNAIKFSKPDGKIEIILDKTENEITLTVLDNGVGISPEKLYRLKENKNYNSEYGTKGEKGSALGYELIHKYAEFNKGKIFIDSTQGKGTTVKFGIPI